MKKKGYSRGHSKQFDTKQEYTNDLTEEEYNEILHRDIQYTPMFELLQKR